MSDKNNSSLSENRALTSHDYDSKDDFNLIDIINFVRINNRYLIGGVVLGAIFSIILAFFLPKQYEAQALIKIGQIGNIDNIGMPIEPALQVVDRLKSQSFQDAVLEGIGISTENEDDEFVVQFRKNLKVKLEKSELISLNLKATSRADASLIMDQVVKQLNLTHDIILKPMVSRLTAELNSNNDELKKAESESELVLSALKQQSDKITDTKFSQTVLLNSIRISKDEELRVLKDNKRLLEERLSPERTFSTHILGKIEVGKKPVFPRYNIFILVGIFLGLLFSVFYIVIKNLKLRLPISA